MLCTPDRAYNRDGCDLTLSTGERDQEDLRPYHLIWQVFKTIPYVPVCVLVLVYVCVCVCVCVCVRTDMCDVCM